MKFNEAAKPFDSLSAMARELGVSRSIVHIWKRKGEVPDPWPFKIAALAEAKKQQS